MSRPNYGKMLRDLNQKGFTMPNVGGPKAGGIPPAIADVACPHCGQRFPVYVGIRTLTFGVSYPMKRGDQKAVDHRD